MVKAKSKGKICAEGKAWAKRTFDTYPSAYANMAASKYCKDPNYAKKAKGKTVKKSNGGEVTFVEARGFNNMLPGKRKKTKIS
jgi:hypothetical protein